MCTKCRRAINFQMLDEDIPVRAAARVHSSALESFGLAGCSEAWLVSPVGKARVELAAGPGPRPVSLFVELAMGQRYLGAVDILFSYSTLLWVLAVALAFVALANVGIAAVWILQDSERLRAPWLYEAKVNRKDVAGYKLTLRKEVGPAELTWLDAPPQLGDLDLEVHPTQGGSVRFATQTSDFDVYFAVREASPETIARLWANGHRLEPAIRFLEHRLGEFSNLTIHGRTLRFEPKYGSISAKLLPEMIRFANAVYDAAAFPPLLPVPPELEQGADYRTPPDAGSRMWTVERPFGEPAGQVSSEQLVRWLYTGRVTPTSRIASAETRSWRSLANVSAFRGFFGSAAPAPAIATKGASPLRQQLAWWLRKPRSHFALALGSVVAMAGAVWLAQGQADWDLALESVAWPTVNGQVTESQKECSSSGSGSTRRTSCSHKLRYVYEVGGERREGNRLRFGAHDETIEQLVDLYPKGRTVSVSYRSLDPDEAVLEPGPTRLRPLVYAYIPLLVGLGVTLPIGAWRLSVLLGLLRRWRTARQLRLAVGA